MLSSKVLHLLSHGKNLLAFSGGVDSSALFFILDSKKIAFDIAIVDYTVREQSKKEVLSAKNLARRFKKECFVLKTDSNFYKKMSKERVDSNFENLARIIRYNFFYDLIQTHSYTNLITAHHFDDKLEWFFMRLCVGSGLNTLLGFDEIEPRRYKNKQFYLLRPLINMEKSELLEYNKLHNIEYFYDKSNENTKFFRNFVRHNILENLKGFKHLKNGIKRSFAFLRKERELIYPQVMICVDNRLFYCKNSEIKSQNHRLHIIDMMTKRLDYILSFGQKKQIDLAKKSSYKEFVFGDKIIVAMNEEFLYVAKKVDFMQLDFKNKESKGQDSKKILIPKKIREQYRKSRIPPKIREVMYANLMQTNFCKN